MVTVQVKLSIEDIIASIPELDNDEREKLLKALLAHQGDLELQADVNEGLEDIENERVYSHISVMSEIKKKYNYKNA